MKDHLEEMEDIIKNKVGSLVRGLTPLLMRLPPPLFPRRTLYVGTDGLCACVCVPSMQTKQIRKLSTIIADADGTSQP